MRIGFDCDGVLRDFIPDLINKIKETHPEHTDKILVPKSWDWEQWLPFWTEDETEKFVFETHYEELFGPKANPIHTSAYDWPKIVHWSKENDHQLILVSAQRSHCEILTERWLRKWGFNGFTEIHFTQDKWSIDVDVLIDDSPSKLKKFKEKSVSNGTPICYKQTWNTECQKKYMTIDRLSDIMTRLFG